VYIVFKDSGSWVKISVATFLAAGFWAVPLQPPRSMLATIKTAKPVYKTDLRDILPPLHIGPII
jgi:hypothetical protein